jgi:hypothetical protein
MTPLHHWDENEALALKVIKPVAMEMGDAFNPRV